MSAESIGFYQSEISRLRRDYADLDAYVTLLQSQLTTAHAEIERLELENRRLIDGCGRCG